MRHTKTVTTLTPEVIDNFRSSLCARGRLAHTVKAYSSDLRMLLFELETSSVPMEEFEETASNWLTANRKRLSPKTTGRRLTSLRAFGRWAGWGVILEDYQPPRADKTQPHPIPEGLAGLDALLACARDENEEVLIALCGLMGLRISEALDARPSHFDLEAMTLKVRGKGDVTRTVPIGPRAWSHLMKPLVRAYGEGDRPLVPLGDRLARALITKMGKRANLRRAISSHDLRATFATTIYDGTLNLRLTQELLGHRSSTTTEIYTLVTREAMKAAVAGL